MDAQSTTKPGFPTKKLLAIWVSADLLLSTVWFIIALAVLDSARNIAGQPLNALIVLGYIGLFLGVLLVWTFIQVVVTFIATIWISVLGTWLSFSKDR